MMGRPQQQVLGAPWYLHPQEEDVVFSSLSSFRTATNGMVLRTWDPHSYSQGFVSMEILNPLKLPIKIPV